MYKIIKYYNYKQIIYSNDLHLKIRDMLTRQIRNATFNTCQGQNNQDLHSKVHS